MTVLMANWELEWLLLPPVEEETTKKQKKATPSPLMQNQFKKQGTQAYNKMKEYYLSPIQDIMD